VSLAHWFRGGGVITHNFLPSLLQFLVTFSLVQKPEEAAYRNSLDTNSHASTISGNTYIWLLPPSPYGVHSGNTYIHVWKSFWLKGMNGIGMDGGRVVGLGTLYTVGCSYWGQLHASLSHNELTSSHGVGWRRGQDSMAHESPYLFT